MDVTAVVLVAATIFVWGTVSARLERADLTAPIVFVAVGAILAALGLFHPSSAPESLKPLVEVTLVWVLFSDAARVRVPDLGKDLGRYARLLGIGLPLTVVLGWVLALWRAGTGSSPRSAEGWPSALRRAGVAPSRSCSSSRRAVWSPCWCGSRSA